MMKSAAPFLGALLLYSVNNPNCYMVTTNTMKTIGLTFSWPSLVLLELPEGFRRGSILPEL